MISWKVLCVLLLLYSKNFGESRCLEKDSTAVKKSTPAEQAEVTRIAQDLERRITRISYSAARTPGI